MTTTSRPTAEKRAPSEGDLRHYVSEINEIHRQYRSRAGWNGRAANVVSVSFVAVGAAVGLAGMARGLPDEFTTMLGVAIIVLERVASTFKPVQRAVHYRRTTHELERELRLLHAHAMQYRDCGGRRDVFVRNVETILGRAHTAEDRDELNLPGPTGQAAAENSVSDAQMKPAI